MDHFIPRPHSLFSFNATVLLLKPEILQKVWILRKLLYGMDEIEAMEFLLDKMKATKNNAEFFDMMRRGG